jgi:hypothetical protein
LAEETDLFDNTAHATAVSEEAENITTVWEGLTRSECDQLVALLSEYREVYQQLFPLDREGTRQARAWYQEQLERNDDSLDDFT